MATLVEVENALAALLALSGRVVVQGRIGEDGAPPVPYVMWRLDTVELQDFTESQIRDDQQVIISPNTPLVFVLNWAGGSAMADATLFGLSLRQSQRAFDLYRLCGLSGIDRLQDLSAVETGTFRQRVETRLTLFTAVELTAPLELIETSCIRVREALKEFDETYCYTQGECL